MKIDKQQLGKGLRFAAMVALTVLSCYACSPRRGFVSTLPFIPLACLLSSLLYYSPKTILALVALCSFSFPLGDGLGSTTALLICAFATLAALLSVLAAKHLARCFQSKRLLSLIFALLLLVPTVLGQAALFSTPWDNAAAAKHFQAYVAEKYPDQSFLELRTSYNLRTASFEGLLRFSGGDKVVLEESIVLKDGIIHDEDFFLRFCQKGLEKRQSEYVSIIRSQYPNEKLWLDCSKTTLNSTSLSTFSGSYGTVPQWLKDSTALELGFQFSITDSGEFLQYVKEYFALLNASGFSYEQIRFYGGDQGTYLYTLTAGPDTPPEELASLLRSCYLSMNIPSISLEYSYLQ